jgi:hypothetical protein
MSFYSSTKETNRDLFSTQNKFLKDVATYSGPPATILKKVDSETAKRVLDAHALIGHKSFGKSDYRSPNDRQRDILVKAEYNRTLRLSSNLSSLRTRSLNKSSLGGIDAQPTASIVMEEH